MATATLTFDLTDHFERMDHECAVRSKDMAMFIWDLLHNSKKALESSIGREIDTNSEMSPYDALDIVYDRIQYLLDERDITISRLTY